jgi:hypothetical protein
LFDDGTRLRIEIKRTGSAAGPVEMKPDATALVSAWAASSDRRSFVMPMGRLAAGMSSPSAEYETRATVEQIPAPDDKRQGAKSRRVANTVLRTDARGALAPF